MRHDRAEELRRRYHYRCLIVPGRLRLSRTGAARPVGPDCAYHLYRTMAEGTRGGAQQPRDGR